MDTSTTVLATALVLLVTVLLAASVGVGWYRVMAADGRLRLWEAMRRRRLAPEDAAGHERGLAVAVRRCVVCSSHQECQHWLDTRTDAPGAALCPNVTFMENLAREKRRVTAKR
ncbi:MAG TPA: DUF6455 family protein [Burkholderiales bacterium]|nr:DUF6455 family protein [Burkholderiales bacterium]